jgi:hypothetical protein
MVLFHDLNGPFERVLPVLGFFLSSAIFWAITALTRG